MRCVLLHYHFFKNAGTTIEEILAHSFGHFARLDNPDPHQPISNPELLAFLEHNPLIQGLSSHHINYPVPQAPGYLFFDICILRDPVDRLRSMYDYFREKPFPGYTLSDLANRSTLPQFLERLVNDAPFYLNDVQVNLVANGEWDHRPCAEDLERATRRVLTASFLGVVDIFRESLIAAEYALKTIFPTLNCAQPAANVSSGSRVNVREICPPELYEELMRLNALDFELLNRARSEIERRFNKVPDGARTPPSL
ncbi:MAG: hypothetical protein JO307_02980 [Bryobacterales bacterium]|nr:hypothetical protein [Bryobacterales bacterium]MBV9398683.1 hypothetical protein [Bryobacterales bacterium]